MDTNFFSEKFTWHLKKTLLRAYDLAARNSAGGNSDFVFTGNETAIVEPQVNLENLLESLKFEQGSIAAEVLNKTARDKKKTVGRKTSRHSHNYFVT